MGKVSFSPISTDAQIKEVSALAYSIWREHYPSIIGKEQVEYMLKKFQSEEAIAEQIRKSHYEYYFINGPKRSPVGYLAIVPKGDELFLSKLYIRKTERGKGYGNAAMEFVKEKAKTIGALKITLTVNRKNVGSIAMYKKNGFVEAGDVDVDIGEKFSMCDHKMELRLR